MNAIVKIGGKQYNVKEKDVIYVELLDVEAGKTVSFDEILMLGTKVGNPFVKGATVEATVVKHGKQKKIRVFRYTPKQRTSRRTLGHRQPYTKLEITKVG